MNQTEHYELNQWDPEDLILREDFNADNLKIDAALAGKLNRIERIFHLSATNPESKSGISSTYTPSILQWRDYYSIIMTAEITEKGEGYDNPIRIRFNGVQDPVLTLPENSYILVFLPGYNGEGKVRGFALSDCVRFFSCDLTFNQLEYIYLAPTKETMYASDRWFIGIK